MVDKFFNLDSSDKVFATRNSDKFTTKLFSDKFTSFEMHFHGFLISQILSASTFTSVVLLTKPRCM